MHFSIYKKENGMLSSFDLQLKLLCEHIHDSFERISFFL